MNLQNLNTSLSNAVRGGQGNSSSRWMSIVYIVAAVLIIGVVALVVVPLVLPQLRGGNQAGGPVVPAGKPAVVKAAQNTPTTTQSPTATTPPTSLPTLTPAPTETAVIFVTQIAYAYADSNTPSNCTVTASTVLNLRGDPSLKQRGIGRVMAGSVLPVTGRSGDEKWWRVINNANNLNVEGWVSSEFVTADQSCADSAIPVVGPTVTPSRTPRPR